MKKQRRRRRGLSRRAFVGGIPAGLLAAAAGSPLWSRLISRAAVPPGEAPQCFITIYTADGTIPDWFWPASTGALQIPDDRLTDLSGTSFNTTVPAGDRPTFLQQPIAPYAANTLMVRGLDGGEADHAPAVQTVLTGNPNGGDSLDTFVSYANEQAWNFARILRLGVYGNQVSYNGAWSPCRDGGNWVTPSWQPVSDAQQVLNAIGGELPIVGGGSSGGGVVVEPDPQPDPGPGPPDATTARRMSRVAAFGAVRERLTKLRCAAGSQAAARAEAYLEEISKLEAVEQQLLADQPAPPPPPDDPPPPVEPPSDLGEPFTIDPNPNDPALLSAQNSLAQLPAMLPFMTDLSVAALATGYTQTITQLWGASGSNKIDNGNLVDYRYDQIPHIEYLGAGDHALAHPGDGAFMDAGHTITAEVSTRDRVRIQRFFYAELRNLLDRLSGIPYGDGTLFDYTTVMVCSEFAGCPSNSYAGQHDTLNLPMLVVAGDHTPFQTGKFMDVGGGQLMSFLSTMAAAYGADMGGGTLSGIAS